MMFLGRVFVVLVVIITALVVVFYYFVVGKKELPQEQVWEQESEQEYETSLKQKIGQMLMIGFRGVEASENSHIARVIKDLHVGGVVLFDYDVPSQSFPRNIVHPEQVNNLISQLQSYSSIPLFVAVDAEGGKVNRLKEEYGFSRIPSAKKMGEDKTLKTTTTESKKLAIMLKELGFNMNLAPVVDLNLNPKNPIIGALGRSFSSYEQEVVDNARVFIERHKEQRVIAVPKHFPGHGSSLDDSHLGIVDVTNTYQEKELYPYHELQQEGLLDIVMTAHIVHKGIDKDYPATLSEKFLQKMLREEISFEGVIVSDDMQMGAIIKNYGFKEAIIKAVNAGCDIILLSNNGTESYNEQLPYEAVDIIYKAVTDGVIPIDRVQESYRRIYALKEKFGIITLLP